MSRFARFDRERTAIGNLRDRLSVLEAFDVVAKSEPVSRQKIEDVDRACCLIHGSCRRGSAAIAMIGGHLIKLGLSRFLVDLVDGGHVSCVATNGAGVIHDFELAMFGETSEDVEKWIKAGQFGLWKETGQLNAIAIEAAERDEGFGEAVGRTIMESGAPYAEISIAAACWRNKIPLTCHVSIGSDIIHAHPNCDGAALGKASYADFLIFACQVQNLEGGVFLNIGSAVTGPEVFLKALSMARNVAHQRGEKITDFTTAVFDLVDLPNNFRDGPPGMDHPLYYFRPWKTLLCRTVSDGGRSHYVKGDFRETIPALWAALTQNTGATRSVSEDRA